MSGRPAEENQESWADTATYPAGTDPWSGQATRVTPGADYFTPNLPIPAEDLNYLIRGAMRNPLALLSYLGAMPGLNMSGGESYEWDPVTPFTVSGVAYDAARGLWVYTGTFNSFHHLHGMAYLDSDRTEYTAAVGSQPHAPGHINGSDAIDFFWTEGDGVCHRWDVFGTTTPHTSSAFLRANSLVLGGTRAFTVFSRTAGATTVLSSIDGTTWTDVTSGLVSTPTANRWGLCQGLTRGIAYKNDFTTPDGYLFFLAPNGTLTEGSLGAAWAAGYHIQAMAYSPETNQHLCAIYSYTANETRILRSSDDGATWAQVAGLGDSSLGVHRQAPGTVVALGAIGSLWMALLREPYDLGSPAAAQSQLALSIDGGANWYRTDYVHSEDLGTISDLAPGILTAGHRALIYNDKNVILTGGFDFPTAIV